MRYTPLTNGVSYSFSVWVKDRSGLYSPARTARLIGTATTIAASTTALTYGGTVRVTGRVTRTDTKARLAGVRVYLHGRRKGTTTWVVLGSAVSSSYGYLSIYHKPVWSLDYRWQYAGSTAFMGTTSSLRSVSVYSTVSATLSASSVPLGRAVTLYGTVAPNHAGSTVHLQRLVSGRWVTVGSRVLTSSSTYSFTLKPTARGYYYYRTYLGSHADHLTGISPTRTLRIY